MKQHNIQSDFTRIFVTFSICFMQMMQFLFSFSRLLNSVSVWAALGTFQVARPMEAAADTTWLVKVRSLTEDH